MDKKIIGKLLAIASVCLLLSATIFICLCLFSAEKNNIYLGIALGSLILSSLFNTIRRQNSKQAQLSICQEAAENEKMGLWRDKRNEVKIKTIN